MRLALVALLPFLLAGQDAKDIVRRALEADEQNDRIARNYVYLERDATTTTTRVQLQERRRQTVRNYEVMLVDGSPYRRLIGRDDMPLSPSEQRKGDQRLRKIEAQRAKESETQRRKRIESWDRQREKKREQYRDIPEAFDFAITGESRQDGADVWVIEATPRPAFRATTRLGRAILPKVHCTFWISKADYAWVKADIVVMQSVWFPEFLIRLSKDSRVSIEQTRVNDEVWLPKSITISLAMRGMLLATSESEVRTEFGHYRRFQADSRVIGFEQQK